MPFVRIGGGAPAPLLGGAAAVAVYGHGLGRLPLWRDEVASVDIASRPVAGIVAAAGRIDVVHTAYYLLLHGVLAFGDAEAWVRLPSLLAAVAAVVLTVELARRRLGPGPALVVAALLVGNPWFASYAREARPYALGAALVAAAALTLLGAPPTRRRWAAFTALGVAATWVHLFDLLPVAVIGTSQALRAQRRGWAGCAVVTVLAVAPLVAIAAAQAGQVSWVGRPTGDDFTRLRTDLAGTPAGEITIGVLLLLAAVLAAFLPSRGPAPGRDRPGELLATALTAALAGPAVLLVVTWLGRPLYVERYVLASVPLLALAAGAAVRVLAGSHTPSDLDTHRRRSVWGPRGVCGLLVAVVTVAGVPAAAAGPVDKTEDLRAGAAYLAAGYSEGDCVAYDPGWARVGFAYYLGRTSARPEDVALDTGRPVVALFPEELPLDHVVANLRACRRVWVVGYPGAVGAWRPVPEVTGDALGAVVPAFSTGTTGTFGDLAVTLLTGVEVRP